MSGLRISLPESIAQLDRLTMQLLTPETVAIEGARQRVSPDEERVLDYFWDRKRNKVRGPLPETVIVFFENAGLQATSPGVAQSWVRFVTRGLATRGLLARRFSSTGSHYYELTRAGSEHLTRSHPVILAWWERFLRSAPPTATLIASAVGLIASMIGIVELIRR